MTTKNTDARKYELMLVLKADKSDDGINKYIEEIKGIVVENGGEIFFEDVWGRRDLAYTIKKEDVGYYLVWNLEMGGEGVKELNDHLRIDQMVLRYLLLKTPKGYEPTPVTEKDLEWTRKIEKEEEKEEEEKEEKPKKKEEPKKEEVIEETPEEEEEKIEEEDPGEETSEEEVVNEEVEEEAPEEEEEIEEEASEEEESKEEPKKEEEKKTMDDLDEKLKAIMNDTDIDISL